ncbi:MAG: hypothetical protein AABW85_04115 [archaeon]
MKKDEWLKVCPFCKSEYFSVDKSNKLVAGGLLRGYACFKCNRSFTFPLEISKENEKGGFV